LEINQLMRHGKSGAPEHFRSQKSGRGQPHSKTSRTELRAGERASVLECGCPLPLFWLLKCSGAPLSP